MPGSLSGPDVTSIFTRNGERPRAAPSVQWAMTVVGGRVVDRAEDSRTTPHARDVPTGKLLCYLHGVSTGPTNDTDPRIEAILIEGYRRMSPAQKLAQVGQLTRTVQELARLDVRRRHPEADEHEQALRVASRWIDRDLMIRAFGWDVRVAGY